MPYSLDFIPDGSIVRMVRHGRPGTVELMESNAAAVDLAAERGAARVLVDIRAVREFGPAIELYHPTTGLPDSAPSRPAGALLLTPEQERSTRILETVAANFGVPFRRLYSLEDAATWQQQRDNVPPGPERAPGV